MKENDKIAGIFGWPLEHTLSPAMHNAALKSIKSHCVYLSFPVRPESLPDAINGIRALNFAGINVTVPFKEAVMPLLDRITPAARDIGSVNTIVNTKGKLVGHNTDAAGFLKDLTDGGFSPGGKTAMVLGAGGAARAVVHALHSAGIHKIFIANRNEAKGQRLAEDYRSSCYISRGKMGSYLTEVHLLVNATSLGLKAGDPSPVAGIQLPRPLFAYDLIYHRTTRFLAQAKKSGCTTRGGLGMLLYQGIYAFELITGKKAPEQVMRKALVKAMKQKCYSYL